MEKVTFTKVVGFVLAAAFAIAIGVSMWALMVGDFMNTVVVRGDLSGDPPFATLARATRDRVIEAVEHDDLPFALLVQKLGVARQPGIVPLFQTMCMVQKGSRAGHGAHPRRQG